MRKNWLIRLCSFLQKFFDKFRSWWLRENWKQVDSIDAKDLTDSTLQYSTEIQKSLSESLNSNIPAVVVS